jgi:hypothetical protein
LILISKILESKKIQLTATTLRLRIHPFPIHHPFQGLNQPSARRRRGRGRGPANKPRCSISGIKRRWSRGWALGWWLLVAGGARFGGVE